MSVWIVQMTAGGAPGRGGAGQGRAKPEGQPEAQDAALLDAIRVPRPGGHGRPRKRPTHPLADRGYIYTICRRLLRRRGIGHTIPTRVDQRAGLVAPLALTRPGYRRRNVVERCEPAQAVRGIGT
jgi:hypothetical protein